MSQIAISGNASGTGVFTIASPNSNSNYTATLAEGTGTVVLDTLAQTLTNKTLTSPTITGATFTSPSSSLITAGTAVATTSGTSVNFTSLPSWIKRVTMLFNSISLSGNSSLLVRLGSGTAQTTGYITSWAGAQTNVGGLASLTVTNGFPHFAPGLAAATSGGIVFSNITGNTWVGMGSQVITLVMLRQFLLVAR